MADATFGATVGPRHPVRGRDACNGAEVAVVVLLLRLLIPAYLPAPAWDSMGPSVQVGASNGIRIATQRVAPVCSVLGPRWGHACSAYDPPTLTGTAWDAILAATHTATDTPPTDAGTRPPHRDPRRLTRRLHRGANHPKT